MTVYIIVYVHEMIESVWPDRASAEQALLDHAKESGCPTHYYDIVERPIGKSHKPEGMKLVVVESPLNAPSPEGVSAHRRYAKRAMHDCLMKGEAPYASHLLYAQPDILDDRIPHERHLGIQAGFAWDEKADLVVVYADLGISLGMRQGIERAIKAGQPIEYRYFGKEE